jgi:hypothetical protein
VTSPPAPPTVTAIWAAFAGRTAKRPDKAEIAKSLESIILTRRQVNQKSSPNDNQVRSEK